MDPPRTRDSLARRPMNLPARWYSKWLRAICPADAIDWAALSHLVLEKTAAAGVVLNGYSLTKSDKVQRDYAKLTIRSRRIADAIRDQTISGLEYAVIPRDHLTVVQDAPFSVRMSHKDDIFDLICDTMPAVYGTEVAEGLVGAVAHAFPRRRLLTYLTAAGGLPMNIAMNYDRSPGFLKRFSDLYQVVDVDGTVA